MFKSLRSKIIFFNILIICILSLLFIFLIYNDYKDINNLIKEKQTEKDTIIKRVLAVKSKPVLSMAYDFSYWDEMLNFSKNPDPEWASINIDNSSATFDVEYAYVYNQDLKLIYKYDKENSTNPKDFPLNEKELLQTVTNNPFSHFYISANNKVIEYSTAPIQPSSDIKRETMPQGYYITGRNIGDKYIHDLEELTESKITLNFYNNDNKYKDYHIYNFASLNDNLGKEIATLEFETGYGFLHEIIKKNRIQHIITILTAVIIFLLMTLFFFKYINFPLKLISKSLSSGSSEPIENLKITKNEFGNISNLISDSFKQKQLLVSEIEYRKKIEEELLKSKVKAEEANQMKSSFLANMSHEFRTPLNAIIGFTEILKDEVKNEELYKHVSYIESSSYRLMNTLNSLLELVELENADVKPIIKSFNLYFELSNCIELYNDKLKEKNLDVILEVDKQLIIKSDRKLANIVIKNIIDNAIKYTSKGYIKIYSNQTIENNCLFEVLNIQDTGIGISNDKINMIFDDFRQASEGYSRHYEGVGIGLSIAKKIMMLLNCKIEIESKVGIGSTFKLFFPVESISNKEELMQNKQYANPKCLIVEDNIDNNLLFQIWMKDYCKTDYAYTPKEALVKSVQNKYDIYLIDINLASEIDGIELMKEIKNIHDNYKSTFIAITGYSTNADEEFILNSGFDFYLSKPVGKKDIESILTKIIN